LGEIQKRLREFPRLPSRDLYRRHQLALVLDVVSISPALEAAAAARFAPSAFAAGFFIGVAAGAVAGTTA
jgi:hypothetical protein